MKTKKKLIGLFSGIGGLELGTIQAYAMSGIDLEPILHCEMEPYPVSVLRRHYPDVPIHSDVRTLVDVPEADVCVFGFPCQDCSIANTNNPQGLNGARSGLFHEGWRIAKACGAELVLIENVPAIRKRGLQMVIDTIVADGYTLEWDIVSAADVGAPHLRKRWFAIAHRESELKYHDKGRLVKWLGDHPPLRGATINGVVHEYKPPINKKDKKLLFPTVTRDSSSERSTRYAQGGLPLTMAVAQMGEAWPTPSANDGLKGDTQDVDKIIRREEQGRQRRLGDIIRVWPTPTLKGNYNKSSYEGKSGDGIITAVNKWPTPRASKVSGDSVARFLKAKAEGKVSTPPLETAVWMSECKRFPTPAKSTAKGVGPIRSKSHDHNLKYRNLHAVIQESVGVTGKLSPEWTELLMGFPRGYTWSEGQPEHDMIIEWGVLHPISELSPWEIGTKVMQNRAKRIRALGNAVVPACAFMFLRRALSPE